MSHIPTFEQMSLGYVWIKNLCIYCHSESDLEYAVLINGHPLRKYTTGGG